MSVDRYVAGFRDRALTTQQPGQELIDEPGVVGLVGRTTGTLDGRVLVTDDRALDVLTARLPALSASIVRVFRDAASCHRLMSESERYRPTRCAAMVCDDLDAIPDLPLAAGLSLRPISTGPGDNGGVPLADAAVAALRSDVAMAPTTDLHDFLDYLRSIPNSRYLAAVDDHGVVRATAASANWHSTTGVYFVNTDPEWRGRGVGTAMTATALRAAAAAGARLACLDASAMGLSIYLRLGFEQVGAITQFVGEA
jgi:GNAT superfamily N-acetyltransferase